VCGISIVFQIHQESYFHIKPIIIIQEKLMMFLGTNKNMIYLEVVVVIKKLACKVLKKI
jgi:hypothetical protein